jgi:hypothetical protein
MQERHAAIRGMRTPPFYADRAIHLKCHEGGEPVSVERWGPPKAANSNNVGG